MLPPPQASLFGHSLGGVISWDILGAAAPAPLRVPVGNLFLLGCPLGLFLTMRNPPPGEVARAAARLRRRGVRIVNLYHPCDPVAYRLDPLCGAAVGAPAGAWPPSRAAHARYDPRRVVLLLPRA